MDKAREYAISILEDQIEIIADAYRKGFEEGKKCKIENEKTRKYLNEPVEVNGVKYFDMGLPSGTLWSGLRAVTPNRNGEPFCVVSALNLPTVEQYKELFEACEVINAYNNRTKLLTGPSGKSMVLYQKQNFWIKSKIKNNRVQTCYIGEEHKPYIQEKETSKKLGYYLVIPCPENITE